MLGKLKDNCPRGIQEKDSIQGKQVPKVYPAQYMTNKHDSHYESRVYFLVQLDSKLIGLSK